VEHQRPPAGPEGSRRYTAAPSCWPWACCIDELGSRASTLSSAVVCSTAPQQQRPGDARRGVFVVGGANSAGQAAIFLGRFAAKVTLLIRGSSLSEGMSDYLVRELEALRT